MSQIHPDDFEMDYRQFQSDVDFQLASPSFVGRALTLGYWASPIIAGISSWKLSEGLGLIGWPVFAVLTVVFTFGLMFAWWLIVGIVIVACTVIAGVSSSSVGDDRPRASKRLSRDDPLYFEPLDGDSDDVHSR